MSDTFDRLRLARERHDRRTYMRPVPVSELHPEIRHTRLGAILRDLVQTGSPHDDATALANAVIARSPDHSRPMDLLPLGVLRDYMLENPDHPLAKRFNWDHLPEKFELDRSVRSLVDEHNATVTARGGPRIFLGHLRLGNPSGPAFSHVGVVFQKLKERHPWATARDINQSVMRLVAQSNARYFARDPETGVEDPAHAERSHADEADPRADQYYHNRQEKYARDPAPAPDHPAVAAADAARKAFHAGSLPTDGYVDALHRAAGELDDAGDWRHWLFRKHAALMADIPDAPHALASDTRRAAHIRSAWVPVARGGRVRVRVEGDYDRGEPAELRSPAVVYLSWEHHPHYSGYGGWFHPHDALDIAGELAAADPAAGRTVRRLLADAEPREEFSRRDRLRAKLRRVKLSRRGLKPVRYSHEAFAARIAENPQDHLPSLVYADYLDENGLPGVAEVIRRSIGRTGEGVDAFYPSDPQPWTGYHVPPDHPVGVPSAFLYRDDAAARRRPDPTVGVGVLFRFPGMAKPAGYGAMVSPEDAVRIFSGMPGVRNADKATAEVRQRYPHRFAQPPEPDAGPEVYARQEKKGERKSPPRPAVVSEQPRAWSVGDIRDAHAAAGGRFFHRGDRRYDGRRVERTTHAGPGGVFFVTSEMPADGRGDRRWSVHEFAPDNAGHVRTHGFRRWATAAGAHAAAAGMAQGRQEEGPGEPQRNARAGERPVRYGAADLPLPEMAGFHAAMHANPRDHLPALVYADWLDEHDMPTVAELIRRHADENDAGHFGGDPPLGARKGQWQALLFGHAQSPGFYVVLKQASASPLPPGRPGGTGLSWMATGIPMGEYDRVTRGLRNEGVHLVPGGGLPRPESPERQSRRAKLSRLRELVRARRAAYPTALADAAASAKMVRMGETPRKFNRESLHADPDMPGFHAAMHANPADALNPMVYADWLDEHGKSAVAAFIRRHVVGPRLDPEVPNQPVSTYTRWGYPVPPGEFEAQAIRRGRGPDADASIILSHGSHHRDEAFLWHSPDMPATDAQRELAALEDEGVRVTPGSDLQPHRPELLAYLRGLPDGGTGVMARAADASDAQHILPWWAVPKSVSAHLRSSDPGHTAQDVWHRDRFAPLPDSRPHIDLYHAPPDTPDVVYRWRLHPQTARQYRELQNGLRIAGVTDVPEHHREA